jgi:hypothetical protein
MPRTRRTDMALTCMLQNIGILDSALQRAGTCGEARGAPREGRENPGAHQGERHEYRYER